MLLRSEVVMLELEPEVTVIYYRTRRGDADYGNYFGRQIFVA